MYIRKSTRVYNGRTYTNYVLVESVQTPKGPRQKTVCSLGDLSPRPRQEWLKLACKIEDALVGQGDLLDADDAEVADIVRRVRSRRAKNDADTQERLLPSPLRRAGGGALIEGRSRARRHRAPSRGRPGPCRSPVLAAPRTRPHSARLQAVRIGATAGLRDGAQSIDRTVLRTRHAGLDPTHRARGYSRARLR